MKGVINYSSSDIVLTFNGLNPALRYEIVCFGNRDNISYQNRLTQTQIVGAESYENRSTLGSVVQSIGSAQDSTIIVNGYNTENGYVARYTQIDPGQDWEVKIRVSDGGSTQPSKQYISALMLRAMLTEEHVVIQTTVSNSGDDAEEHLTRKTVSISSSDLELGEDKEEAQEVGVRFNGLGIPEGAQVTYAAIQFTVDEISLGPCQVLIETTVGADVDAFTSDAENLSRRIRSLEQVSWDISDWKRIGESGEDQRTPDLSSLLQEVIDQPEWNPGESMVFLLSGTGRRTAESWDGKALSAPLLIMEYIQD